MPFPKSEACFPVFGQITAVLRALWPKKTAAHVSFLTGVSERAVKFWLAGETRMSVEHVTTLLRTEEGYAVLAAIMGDAEPEWWIIAKSGQSVRTSRKNIKREQDRIAAARAQLDLLDQ